MGGVVRVIEQDRQHYLAQFGVVQWYARAQLPGAAPSPGFVFAEVEETPQHRPSALSLVENKSPQMSPTPQSERLKTSPQRPNIADIAPFPIEQADSATVPVSDDEGRATGSEAFRSTPDDKAVTYLGCLTRNISFVAQFEGEILPESVSSEMTLFRNIVAACDSTGTAETRTFQWPPLPHPGLPGHTAENKWLLLNRWVSGGKGDSSARIVFFGALPETLGQKSNWIVQPSLRQALEQPLLKREIWHSLRPLLNQKSVGEDD